MTGTAAPNLIVTDEIRSLARQYSNGLHTPETREAHRIYCKELRRKRCELAATNPERVPHGKSGYQNWDCRCPICMAAYFDSRRRRDTSRTKAPWTDKETAYACRDDIPVADIADVLKRSCHAVVARRFVAKRQASDTLCNDPQGQDTQDGARELHPGELRLLILDEVTEILGLSVRAIQRMVTAGTLRCAKLPDRCQRFLEIDVRAERQVMDEVQATFTSHDAVRGHSAIAGGRLAENGTLISLEEAARTVGADPRVVSRWGRCGLITVPDVNKAGPDHYVWEEMVLIARETRGRSHDIPESVREIDGDGGWAKLLRWANKLVSEEKTEIVERYRAEDALSVKALAEEYGCSYHQVRHLLKSAGILRPHGGRRRSTSSNRPVPETVSRGQAGG